MASPGDTKEATYLPGLRFRSLNSIYDPLIRLTVREALFKRRLLEQAAIEDGQRVLDLGCGTGTLAIMAKQRHPGAELVGLDADPEMLGRAGEKASREGVELRLDEGFSNQLPYEDSSFDRVLTSLFFHHLSGEVKRSTIAEVARVLVPGGELHVADWGRASDPVMRALFVGVRVFDGWENTSANAAGALPEMFEAGGLADAGERSRLRTPFGTLALYSAVKPR